MQLHVLLKSEAGQDLIEYGLLVTLIALVATGAVQLLAGGTVQLWEYISNQLDTLGRSA
jgi:Flp pilus assembly pilin Flp